MNLFLNTAYNKIEIFVFKKDYEKLYIKDSLNDHTKNLYLLIKEVINFENIQLDDFQKIYIVNGPGSFTGIRIGVLFAKTLAYEKNIEIVPVNYLEILYLTNDNKAVAIDGRGKSFFFFDGLKSCILKKEELNENTLVDSEINYDKLIENLKKFKSENPKEIKIEYLKNPV